MKQNEILEEINRLKGEIDRLEKEVNRPKDEIIYVPQGILRDRTMSIINGKHILFCDDDGWNAEACNYNLKSTEKQWQLVPCKRDELEARDVAFFYLPYRDSDINYEKENVSNYYIITEEGIVCWDEDNAGVTVCDYELNSDYVWYKVVKA